MTPRLRKLMLTAHVTCSVGSLGSVAVFLALAVAGLTSQDAQMVRAGARGAFDLQAKGRDPVRVAQAARAARSIASELVLMLHKPRLCLLPSRSFDTARVRLRRVRHNRSRHE